MERIKDNKLESEGYGLLKLDPHACHFCKHPNLSIMNIEKIMTKDRKVERVSPHTSEEVNIDTITYVWKIKARCLNHNDHDGVVDNVYIREELLLIKSEH